MNVCLLLGIIERERAKRGRERTRQGEEREREDEKGGREGERDGERERKKEAESELLRFFLYDVSASQ